MTLLSNEENKEISLSLELSQASTEKVNDLTARCEEYVRFFVLSYMLAYRRQHRVKKLFPAQLMAFESRRSICSQTHVCLLNVLTRSTIVSMLS